MNYSKMFGCRIDARIPAKKHEPLVKVWEGYTFDQIMKWKWYFKYRAALIQVQNPKADVNFIIFDYQATGFDLQKIIKNQIKAKKGNITKNQSKLNGVIAEFEDFKFNLQDFFPEENPTYNQYQKAISMQQMKVNRLIHELKELENELINV
jgi:uncharacterized coiled-coil protein SlyX